MTTLGRRALVAGGVVVGVSACGDSASPVAGTTTSPSATTPAPLPESTAGGGSDEPLAKEEDVHTHPIEVTAPMSGDPAFLLRVDDEVVMLSAVCTHSGCSVAWRDADGEFECPCHRGRYDATGAVTSGPPPEPLHRLPVQVRDGQIYAVSA